MKLLSLLVLLYCSVSATPVVQERRENEYEQFKRKLCLVKISNISTVWHSAMYLPNHLSSTAFAKRMMLIGTIARRKMMEITLTPPTVQDSSVAQTELPVSEIVQIVTWTLGGVQKDVWYITARLMRAFGQMKLSAEGPQIAREQKSMGMNSFKHKLSSV
jgi:hypothetical protein